MNTYAFLIRRPSGRDLLHLDSQKEPLSALEALVDDELYDEPDQPGLWATLDRKTTVERHIWRPVGSLPEDGAGSGVPVVAA